MEEINTSGMESIFVKQKLEWGEILTGFECENKYEISNSLNNETFLAAEESSPLYRWFLKRLRPLTLHILTALGQPALKAKKPFKFYFEELQISDADGQYLGVIKKKFAVFSNQYVIEDAQGNELYKIHGPFFHPWTFNILKNDVQIGQIIKNWSGVGKEMFTDADNFSATFPVNTEPAHKAILLGALFLIDLLYFEK